MDTSSEPILESAVVFPVGIYLFYNFIQLQIQGFNRLSGLCGLIVSRMSESAPLMNRNNIH